METKIIQVTAARGPDECKWVVAKVLKIFLKELVGNQIIHQILHKENGIENGTVQSVTIAIKGKDLSTFLNAWIGTIQWIGTSNFRKYNKRKNWYIGCFELKQFQQKEIKENEIQFQAIRSSGAGGQHVNKVSSAVRAKHKPTGIQVLVMDSRSQHQNKKIAMIRLKEKIRVHNIEQMRASLKASWENHSNVKRGNPIRTFTGSNFKEKKQDKSYKKTRHQLKKEVRDQIE